MDFYYLRTISFINNSNISNCSINCSIQKKPGIEKTNKNTHGGKKCITQKVLGKRQMPFFNLTVIKISPGKRWRTFIVIYTFVLQAPLVPRKSNYEFPYENAHYVINKLFGYKGISTTTFLLRWQMMKSKVYIK